MENRTQWSQWLAAFSLTGGIYLIEAIELFQPVECRIVQHEQGFSTMQVVS
jgi:hypothetical protein